MPGSIRQPPVVRRCSSARIRGEAAARGRRDSQLGSPGSQQAKARSASSSATVVRLARAEVDLGERAQLARRADELARRRLDVELDDLGAGAVARVGDVDLDGQRAARREASPRRRAARRSRSVA